MRGKLAVTLGGVLLATMLMIPAAHARPEDVPVKNTPNPFVTDDLPGCFGNLNATFNHDSGAEDENPVEIDSKGPGWFFRNGQAFQEAKNETRDLFCGAD